MNPRKRTLSNKAANDHLKSKLKGNKRAKKTFKSGEEEMLHKLKEKEEDENPCYIYKLPREIIGGIFRDYLDPINRLLSEPVSKYWAWMLWEESWKRETKIDFAMVTKGHPEIQRSQITDRHLITLFSRIGKKLKELNLQDFEEEEKEEEDEGDFDPIIHITTELLKSLHLVPNIEVLDLGVLLLRDYDFRRMALHLSRLKSFHYHVYDYDKEAEDCEKDRLLHAGLHNFLLANPALEHLDFYEMPVEAPEFLPSNLRTLRYWSMDACFPFAIWEAARHCPLMEELELSWAPHFIEDFEHLNMWALNEAFEKFKKLRSIEFEVEIDVDYDAEFEEDFTGLGECSDLRKIQLSPSLVSDATLRAISSGCPIVEEFTILNGEIEDELSEDGLASLAELHRMETLKFSDQENLTDAVLRRIAQNNKNLKSLIVSGCLMLTDESIISTLISGYFICYNFYFSKITWVVIHPFLIKS